MHNHSPFEFFSKNSLALLKCYNFEFWILNFGYCHFYLLSCEKGWGSWSIRQTLQSHPMSLATFPHTRLGFKPEKNFPNILLIYVFPEVIIKSINDPNNTFSKDWSSMNELMLHSLLTNQNQEKIYTHNALQFRKLIVCNIMSIASYIWSSKDQRKSLNLPMLRPLQSKGQGHKDLWKSSEPCHVGIHWIALTEYSQMSTHNSQSFSIFSAFLCHLILVKLATSSISVNNVSLPSTDINSLMLKSYFSIFCLVSQNFWRQLWN